MAFHMKTTLNIDDKIMIELKRETARQGKTTSELVETALRLLLRAPRKRADLPPLPTFHSGGMLVDMADRNALYDAMEGRYPREGSNMFDGRRRHVHGISGALR